MAVLCLGASLSWAAEKSIGVFVALADNASQGIVRVPAAIGNGDDPERNLYWGTADGLRGVVVFIGHNGLMDFELPVPAKPARQTRVADCVVLCCKSESYFKPRIESAGGRPVLLTTQLMYPGAFILHAVAGGWLKGSTIAELRALAGAAYATNQKLSTKAGTGVFARLPE